MDLDDLFPQAQKAATAVGDDLSRLSVSELEARIAELEAEIARARAEIDAKRSFKSAAEQVFKS